MKRFHYISPSIIPSRSANSVHVMNQCEALTRMNVEIYLYAKRGVKDKKKFMGILGDFYGVDLKLFNIFTYYSSFSFGDSLMISITALVRCVFSQSDTVLSRNLYAAFLLAYIFRKPIIYETHQLEYGIRKYIQRKILLCMHARVVVISKKLVECLNQHHDVSLKDCIILHDAASPKITPVSKYLRREMLAKEVSIDVDPYRKVCGYFGQLYSGRGIEIIIAMAELNSDILFLIYGGNDEDIEDMRSNKKLKNLIFMGHVTPSKAQKIMCMVDVLLMPYQKNVSIGVDKHDTAAWMSPMKMFEYMAAGVAIISSDLPVLREILKDKYNCSLVEADNAAMWSAALNKIVNDEAFSDSISSQARKDFIEKHTWDKRAQALLRI